MYDGTAVNNISLPGSNGQWLLGQFVQRSGNLAANPASSRAAQEFNYFHQDAQGSTVAVSDANGQTLERMAYDPWGDRRNVTGPADPSNLIAAEKTDRGYTQHEMLDEVGLVHMNGRIYDPYLGRMLTADILVSYPERSTSFNRYTYALNNPLRFVDPSGWDVETCTPSNPSGFDSGYTTSAPKDTGQQSSISMDSVVAMNYGEKLQPIQNQATIKPWRYPGDDSFQQDLARSNLDAAFSMGGDAVLSAKLGVMIAKFSTPIARVAGKAWGGIADFAKSVKTRLFGVADTGAPMVETVRVGQLIPTHGKTMSNNKFKEFTKSIKENGILEPLDVTEYKGNLYILDGHHRALAAPRAGIAEVPIIRRELPYNHYKTPADLDYTPHGY